ncbi:MAG: PIN domain-containing protein [Verrucomicrobia bacterium]|jgi:predicted nucleic acid-binding protein|nr:PIN domain-containing protein [Verrucomicrobiota bacterium]|tara:strand:+ start:5677 stop:6108 length:432 start_codon:yes stop_codon:yes gene_type:complete
MIYADTSVLISLAIQDINTGRAAKLMTTATAPLLFNSMLSLEICNAIRLAVGRSDIDEVNAVESEARIWELKRAKMLELVEPDWIRVFQRSLGFARAHTSSKRTRSFDIVQVAAAVELGARDFWSFDNRQRSLAIEVGLKVNP